DDRRVRRLGVIDGLDRLRHHAVVGGHHQHHDVGHVRAARPHGGEGRVAGRVQEGHALAVLQPHLVGADVLGDAAVLAGHHVGGAQRVQQARLAVVDVAHDGHDRRTRQQVIVHVLGADEAFFHVGFGDALDGVAELGRHQLGGVGVDHVVDLQHHPLTHQELDHLDATRGHAAGQLLHGDHVGDHDFARDLGLFLRAALAPLALALTGAAHRRQAAHAFDGLVVVAGDGLDGQPAFAPLRRPLDAADGLGGWSALAAVGALLVLVGPAVDDAAAGPRGLAGGALDLRAARRRLRPAEAGRTRTARARAAVAAGGRTRGERRIADSLAGARRPVAAGARAIAARAGTIPEGAALGTAAFVRRAVGAARRLALGAGFRAGGRRLGARRRGLGGAFGRRRRGLRRDGLRRGGGRGARGGGFALAAAGFFLGAARGGLARGGFAAQLVGAGGFDHALAGAHLFGGEVLAARAGGRRARRRRRLARAHVQRGALLGGGGTAQAGRPAPRAIDPATLGLDDHGLGAAVAEALLDGACAHPTRTRLQRQGR